MRHAFRVSCEDSRLFILCFGRKMLCSTLNWDIPLLIAGYII